MKVNPSYTEINYAADRASSDSIFAYYQKLIAMRKTCPAILDGFLEFLMKDHPQMVVYLRKCARQTLLVIANFSNDNVKVEIPQELEGHTWKRILTNRDETTPSLESREEWLPWEAEVYELEK